jgi:hypothetical protein
MRDEPYTANEWQIYVFPEMKLRGVASLFPKHNYNVLSPSFNIHVSVSNLYINKFI